jgi:hypothetical protein
LREVSEKAFGESPRLHSINFPPSVQKVNPSGP